MYVRRLLLLIAAACLLLVGCASSVSRGHGSAAGAPASKSNGAVTTVTHTFRPFDAHGKPTRPVTRHMTGYCWEVSLAAPATTSYRCLAANTILDPCFAAHTATPATLACFTSPWSKAVALTVHRALPKDQSMLERPWAVELAGGAKCVAATGTAPFVNGVGLGYICDDGSYAALRGSGAHVRALVGRQGGHTLQHTVVTDLWRG